MLIIDYLDEGNMPAEKPNHRPQPVVAQQVVAKPVAAQQVVAQQVVAQQVVLRKGPGTLDPQYRWAQDQQRNLQQVARNARLLKLAKNSSDCQK